MVWNFKKDSLKSLILVVQPSHNFAHGITALLSCHVQKRDLVGLIFFQREQYEFWQNLDYEVIDPLCIGATDLIYHKMSLAILKNDSQKQLEISQITQLYSHKFANEKAILNKIAESNLHFKQMAGEDICRCCLWTLNCIPTWFPAGHLATHKR